MQTELSISRIQALGMVSMEQGTEIEKALKRSCAFCEHQHEGLCRFHDEYIPDNFIHIGCKNYDTEIPF